MAAHFWVEFLEHWQRLFSKSVSDTGAGILISCVLPKKQTLKVGLAALVFITSSAGFAERQKSLAVFPFQDTKKSKYQYLSNSLPDALVTTIGSLKKFEIISSAKVKAAQTESKISAVDETEGRKLASKLAVDLYVVGFFIVNNNEIQIYGRVYDTETGALVASAKETSSIDTKLFAALDSFTGKLATNLDKAISYEAQTVYKDGMATSTRNQLTLELGGSSLYGSLNYRRNILAGFSLGFGGAYIPRSDFNAYNIKLGIDYHPFRKSADWLNRFGLTYEAIFYNRLFTQNGTDFESFAFGSGFGILYGYSFAKDFFVRLTAWVLVTANTALPYAGLSGGYRF